MSRLGRRVGASLGLALGAVLSSAAVSSVGCAVDPLEGVDLPALGSLADEVDGARLLASVDALVAAHGTETPMECADFDASEPRLCHLTREAAREWVAAQLELMGYTVSRQTVEDGKFTTVNLVAELPGQGGTDEYVLVGAHYDAFYAAADDNSTGVAAMLELARLFAARQPARTIRFVGFDLEELGLVGSSRLVASGALTGTLHAALVFDSIGFRAVAEGSQSSPLGFPHRPRGDFLGVIANSTSEARANEALALARELDLVETLGIVASGSGAADLTGDLMRSDHAPFWLAGQPAVFFTDTANFRNPHYHEATDTPETLDAAFLEQVVRLSAATLALWAGGGQ